MPPEATRVINKVIKKGWVFAQSDGLAMVCCEYSERKLSFGIADNCLQDFPTRKSAGN